MDVTLTSIQSINEASASFNCCSNYEKTTHNPNAKDIGIESKSKSHKPIPILEEEESNANLEGFALNEVVVMDSNSFHSGRRRTSGRLL